MLDFVAIDFETANRTPGSICSVGAVRVRNGRVVDTFTTLVKPPTGGRFTFTYLHGIDATKVRNAPTWAEVSPRLSAFVGGDTVVAHNASFDLTRWRKADREARVPKRAVNYLCTWGAVSAAMPDLPNHKLPTVAAALGVPQSQHHDSTDDARVTAGVLVALTERAGAERVAKHRYRLAGNVLNAPKDPLRRLGTQVARPARTDGHRWTDADGRRAQGVRRAGAGRVLIVGQIGGADPSAQRAASSSADHWWECPRWCWSAKGHAKHT